MRARLPAWSPTQWAVAGTAGVVALVLLAFLLVPREYYTGTNSVRNRSMVLGFADGSTACLPQLFVPAGTGRIEFHIESNGRPRPTMRMTLEMDGRKIVSELPPGPEGRQKIQFAIPTTPEEPEWRFARACIFPVGSHSVSFGGVLGLIKGDHGPTVDGEPVGPMRVATWYLPPAGERRSIISQLPAIFEREALFKASWVGPWTYWLLFLLIVPALVACALRVLLTSERRRRLPLLIGMVAFVNAAAWAHITPAWQAPDESEHYAYVESLAERGKPPSSVTVDVPADAYSTRQQLALEGTRIFSSNEAFDGRPPWLERYEVDYEARVARERPPSDDGGGFSVAASAHSPAYYALLIPAYEAGGSVFDELTLMRLTSALMGGIVAACAALLMLELMPRRRLLAACAGLLVAFQPMFGFMSGAVNNDMGVNAVAAIVLLLLVRTLRRGFRPTTAAGLGLALVALPLMKGTGYALYPAALLGLALAAWRHRERWREQVAAVAALAATFVAGTVAWSLSAGSLDRSGFTTPGGNTPGEGFGAMSNIPDALAYVWQVYLPRLPFMTDHWTLTWPAEQIWGKRGWGAFGWYAISWPEAVYQVITAAMVLVAVLGLVTLWRRREWTGRNLSEVVVLITAVVGVVTAVHFAYYTGSTHGKLFPEQGRYAFPVITVLATLGVGAMFAFRRRVAEPAAAALTAGVIVFSYASMWLEAAGFYFLVLH